MTDTEKAEKYENHLLRSFCALIIFCIIFVHYEPCYTVFGMKTYEVVEGVGRFAMPVFFMISGYFLYSADGHSENSLTRKTKKILVLLVFMKVLYFALDCIYYSAGVISMNELMDGLITMNWSSKHIWFVYFLFFTYALYWILHRKGIDFKYGMIFGVICLVIDLFLASVSPWLGIYEIGGVSLFSMGQIFYCFISFFFFPLGYYLHKYDDRVRTWSTPLLFILMAFGFVLTFVEIFNFPEIPGADRSYSNLYFGSVIIAVTLFILTFRVPENMLRCRPLEFMGRTLLPWMYAFYMAVMFFMKFIVMDNFDIIPEARDLIGMIVSAVLDVVLAYCMYRGLTAIFAGKRKGKAETQQS